MRAGRLGWTPLDDDLYCASAARTWDYWLGGAHNFEVDRRLAAEVTAVLPEAPLIARLSRAFTARVVRACLDLGITQFLDLGCGITGAGGVHEVALAARPSARTMYVDHDEVAVAHTKSCVSDVAGADVLLADIRDPEAILSHPEVAAALDLSRPVAVLMLMVLEFIGESDNPRGVVQTFARALPAGSALAIAHSGCSANPAVYDRVRQVRELYERAVTPLTPRSRRQVTDLLAAGFRVLDPGVVWLSQWRPDGDAAAGPPEAAIPVAGWGGLAVK